jgi:hypothetical protein
MESEDPRQAVKAEQTPAEDHQHNDTQCGITILSRQCLEEIVDFLSVEYIGILSMTCKDCHSILKGGSTGYWKNAFKRLDWPCDDIIGPNSDDDDDSDLRREYVKRYMAVRAAKLVSSAIHALNTDTPTQGVVYQTYAMPTDIFNKKNFVDGVKVWSANMFMVAYDKNCGICLYERKLSDNKEYKECKEVSYWELDLRYPSKTPYRTFQHVALTSEYMCCYCSVGCGRSDYAEDVIVFISREKCVLRDRSKLTKQEIKAKCMIDRKDMVCVYPRDALMGYWSSCDESTDSCAAKVKDLIDNNGDLSEVEISVEGEIKSCGSDRFVIEMKLTIPNVHRKSGDDPKDQTIRQVAMFCAKSGKVVWMGDCSLNQAGTTSKYTLADANSSRQDKTLIFAAGVEPKYSFTVGEVRCTNTQEKEVCELSHYMPHQSAIGYPHLKGPRLTQVFPNSVVTTAFWDRASTSPIMARNDYNTLAIFSRNIESKSFVYKTMQLSEVRTIHKLFAIDHENLGVVALRVTPHTTPSSHLTWLDRVPINAMDVIVVNVPTCTEVCRIPAIDACPLDERELPHVSYSKGTVGVYIKDKGIAIASYN